MSALSIAQSTSPGSGSRRCVASGNARSSLVRPGGRARVSASRSSSAAVFGIRRSENTPPRRNTSWNQSSQLRTRPGRINDTLPCPCNGVARPTRLSVGSTTRQRVLCWSLPPGWLRRHAASEEHRQRERGDTNANLPPDGALNPCRALKPSMAPAQIPADGSCHGEQDPQCRHGQHRLVLSAGTSRPRTALPHRRDDEGRDDQTYEDDE